MPSKLPDPVWSAEAAEWLLPFRVPLSFDRAVIARAMAISYGYPPSTFGRSGARVGRQQIRPALAHLVELRVHQRPEPEPAADAVQAWLWTLGEWGIPALPSTPLKEG